MRARGGGGAYTWSSTSAKERMGLSAGEPIRGRGAAYRGEMVFHKVQTFRISHSSQNPVNRKCVYA